MPSNQLVDERPDVDHPGSLPPGELPVGLEIVNRRGVCWRCDAPVEELWPEQQRWFAAMIRRISPAESLEAPHAEILTLRAALPDNAVAIALQAGEGDSPTLALAGALHTHKGLPIVTQLLARDPSEEAAVLLALEEILAGKACLVTFNGKAVDAPFVAARRARHRFTQSDTLPPHCDLLHHARRRWKSRLPNCRLPTLEAQICGRHRSESDHDAARALQAYLCGGAYEPLRTALHHHAMDIVTLWQLGLWLAHSQQ